MMPREKSKGLPDKLKNSLMKASALLEIRKSISNVQKLEKPALKEKHQEEESVNNYTLVDDGEGRERYMLLMNGLRQFHMNSIKQERVEEILKK
jgi:hypothetical protein